MPLPIRIITNCDRFTAYFYFNPSARSGLSVNSLPPQDQFYDVYASYCSGAFMTIPAASERPLPSRDGLKYDGRETAWSLFECVVRDFGDSFGFKDNEDKVRPLTQDFATSHRTL